MTQIMHSVNHQAQTQEMSCWAASAAMLTGKSETEILEKFKDFGSDGADEPECQRLASELSLTIVPEACRAGEGWCDYVQKMRPVASTFRLRRTSARSCRSSYARGRAMRSLT